MKSITITAMLCFVNSISAWSITWYTGEDCSNDSSFNDASYTGIGNNELAMSSCLLPGDAGLSSEGCVWHTDNDANTASCTAPMNPKPKSFYMTEGTMCRIGANSLCNLDTLFGKSSVDKCVNVKDVPNNAAGDPVYFQCYRQT